MPDNQTSTNNKLATPAASPALRQFLHVGCGLRRPERLPACFRNDGWKEVRFDIDPCVEPDIIGTITDMHDVADASMDGVWSSHNIEHLHSFEVALALAEFRRVLKPTGFALITLPDLRAIARHIVEDRLSEPLYESPAGPISALDVVFGHQASLAAGHSFMAHRTGFTASTLGQHLLDAGFNEVRVHEGNRHDLWAIATMEQTNPNVFARLASVML